MWSKAFHLERSWFWPTGEYADWRNNISRHSFSLETHQQRQDDKEMVLWVVLYVALWSWVCGNLLNYYECKNVKMYIRKKPKTEFWNLFSCNSLNTFPLFYETLHIDIGVYIQCTRLHTAYVLDCVCTCIRDPLKLSWQWVYCLHN
jgi:hypothetical protein